MVISGTPFFKCIPLSEFFEVSLLSCIALVDCVNCRKTLLGIQSQKLLPRSFLKTCGYLEIHLRFKAILSASLCFVNLYHTCITLLLKCSPTTPETILGSSLHNWRKLLRICKQCLLCVDICFLTYNAR